MHFANLVRPPDIVVDRLIFYQAFFFLSSFLRRLISEFTEWNSTISGHMVGSKCNLKTHVQNLGYPISVQIGGLKTTFFARLRISTANLMAYILGTKHIHKRQVRCKLQRISYVVSKRHELWSTNGFKLEVSFHPLSVNFAFHFIAKVCRWRSANGTQPNFAKQWAVNRANNPPYRSRCHPSRIKLWANKLLNLFGF